MSKRIGREVLQFPCSQKNDVGEASERLETSGSDDGGLNLAVDVLGHGVAGIEPVGGENAWKIRFQGFAQSLEGFKATAPCPGDPGAQQGLWVGTRSAPLMNVLVAFFHAPGPSGFQS